MIPFVDNFYNSALFVSEFNCGSLFKRSAKCKQIEFPVINLCVVCIKKIFESVKLCVLSNRAVKKQYVMIKIKR